MPQRPLSYSGDDRIFETANPKITGVWDKLSPPWMRLDLKSDIQPTTSDLFSDNELPRIELSDKPGALAPQLLRPLIPRRQDSERRDNLTLHEPCENERREVSATRRRAWSAMRAPAVLPPPNKSVPNMPISTNKEEFNGHSKTPALSMPPPILPQTLDETPPLSEAPSPSMYFDEPLSEVDSTSEDGLNDPSFRAELEARWILNLSMAFRDKTDREKFFVTFAERPNLWRRITISLDYRDAAPSSLEADLKTLRFQRDKSARIYEAIQESLAEIDFYDTVTNLKLETADGRLHVHVTEDIVEIIKYPNLSSLQHLNVELITESSLDFQSHLSGFVYKVTIDGSAYIKKEIPGPDMVDEFLYEVNALHSLQESSNVINFHGIVVNNEKTKVKGLLISFADKGALVDIIYDHKDTPLPWERCEKWAKQIVAGLSDIHEHGYVQGDFTLSNIVVDHKDDAKIIDVNRRGCPFGWEPPEFDGLIKSGQRISMYIGVKSDIFQLGMVLWALAAQKDEPEREERPLLPEQIEFHLPDYYRDWILSCLSDHPSDRKSARSLLASLPNPADAALDAPPAYTMVPSRRMKRRLMEERVGRRSSREADQAAFADAHDIVSVPAAPGADAVDGVHSDTEVTFDDDDDDEGANGIYRWRSAPDRQDTHDFMDEPQDMELFPEMHAPAASAAPDPPFWNQNFTNHHNFAINHERSSVLESPLDLSRPEVSHGDQPIRRFGHLPHNDSGIRELDDLVHNRRFKLPHHQDSGFVEHMIPSNRQVVSPPPHQDSGFGDDFVNLANQRNTQPVEDVALKRPPDELFAGLGGSF